MATKLIMLADGTLLEIDVPGDTVQQISGGMAAKVDSTLDKMTPTLIKTCRPVVQAVQALHNELEFEHVEIEIGLSFDLEGNVYIAKAQVGANIRVGMTLKRKE